MWNDKPDEYPIPDQNPTGTGMNFYPRIRVRVQISTHNLFTGGRVIALPDPLPSLHIKAHTDMDARIKLGFVGSGTNMMWKWGFEFGWDAAAKLRLTMAWRAHREIEVRWERPRKGGQGRRIFVGKIVSPHEVILFFEHIICICVLCVYIMYMN
jgi:hypothetical protein